MKHRLWQVGGERVRPPREIIINKGKYFEGNKSNPVEIEGGIKEQQ